jgi:hypothetical protein
MTITPLMPVYPRCGFRPVKGEGAYLISEDGRRALDFASGIAVKTIVNLVREAVAREDLRKPDGDGGLSRASIILRDAILRANKIIYQILIDYHKVSS